MSFPSRHPPYHLSKALRPLPEKFHGLTEFVLIYCNVIWTWFPTAKALNALSPPPQSSQKSAATWMDKVSFEVETPVLQKQAVLLPVHLSPTNAQNIDMVLDCNRASPLNVLSLVVWSECMRLGVSFRNEGMDNKSSQSRVLPLRFTKPMQIFKISWTWRKALSNMQLSL